MNRSLLIALALPVTLPLSSPAASAQFSYSITTEGASAASLDGATGEPITAGDILTPLGGRPRLPLNFPQGTALRPVILIGGGQSQTHGLVSPGLAFISHDDCIGTGPGESCPFDIDALSYGRDALVFSPLPLPPAGGGGGTVLGVGGPTAKGEWAFSVDTHAVGDPASTTLAPNVLSEAPSGDSAADVFVDLGLESAPPIGIPTAPGGATGYADGNGLRSVSTQFAYPGIGLNEPTPTTPGPEDNLDAVDLDGEPFPMVNFPAYFSMDSSFWDPKDNDFNSGTAAANGFDPGDVLVTFSPGTTPVVYATAAQLGLDQTMAGEDDVDALCLAENGIFNFQPSLAPYDWEFGGTDMLFFSVRRNSAIIGSLDSILLLPIEEGDILVPPIMGGNGNPGIFVAAENLGLKTRRAYPLDPCGDDLDALDHIDFDLLLAHDYCYGDGGYTTGCTDCLCGNNVPMNMVAGCENSTGNGARLIASGFAYISSDTLRFEMIGGPPSTFGMLVSGSIRLTAAGCPPGSGQQSPGILDGIRCVGGMVLRHGARPTNGLGEIGVTTPGWGPPNGPPSGLAFANAWVACTTRQFQVFYRDDPAANCMTGQNTSNAIQITYLP